MRGFNGKYTQHNDDHESNSDSSGSHIRGNSTDSDSERIIITICIDSSPTEYV